VANYNVDIAVALKGAKQLTSFNREVKATSTSIDAFAKQLKSAAKDQNILVKNLDNLNLALTNAKKNFNAVASGTSLQEKAARQLVLAEKQLNKEYQQREKLLNNLRTSFTPMPLPGSGVGSDPVAKSIARRRRKLMRGANQYSGPIGPGEAVSANLRSPLPPRSDVFLSSPLPPRVPLPPRSSIEPGQSLFGQSVNIERSLKERMAIQNKLFKMEIGQTKAAKERTKQLNKQNAELRRMKIENQQSLINQYSGPLSGIGPRMASSIRQQPRGNIPTFGGLTNRLNLRGQFEQGGAFAATGGQRARGALSNALIGGGFPLLFGQGAIGAAGGGIGGALGGALGGGFGFGLSIAGTAIAQQIQQTLDFRKSIRELNKEMQQMGISSNISGSQVRQLGKSLGITKEEAVKALQEFKRFGDNAVLFAEKFGGDFAKFDAIAQANTVQSALAAIRKINKDITLDDELRFLNSVRRQGVEATINQMLDEMLEKEKKLKTTGFGQGEGKNVGANRKRLGQLRQESDATQEIVDKNKAFLEELTKVRDQFIQNRDAAEAANRSIASGLEEVNAEIRKLNDAQFQVVKLSKTLGSAFSESFKGIIKGTMSVADAFRSMFMRIADHFLDMAAQMMAAQISKGFLGLFGNAFSSFSFGGSASAFPNAFDTSFDMGLLGFANGGRPPVGRPSIVGEKGPELFVPDRAGTVVPNHAMGEMNIIVNVDASGTNVEGDEQQGRELGRLISVAVQSELVQQKRPGGLLA
jgi:hypothetical protein